MTSSNQDIRWKQQFSHFRSAKRFLDQAVSISDPNDIERMGLIQAFEVTVETGWKTLREFMKERGLNERYPKDIVRRAFQFDLVSDAESWLAAINRRNATSHTYDHASVVAIEQEIRSSYLTIFEELEDRLGGEQ